jgi:hypothetical protein
MNPTRNRDRWIGAGVIGAGVLAAWLLRWQATSGTAATPSGTTNTSGQQPAAPSGGCGCGCGGNALFCQGLTGHWG